MPEISIKSVIVEGSINPIKADEINLERVFQVPLKIAGIHEIAIESHVPLVIGQTTLDHARACAERLVSNMANLPVTEQAADLLSMAYAVLHYSKEKS